MTLAAPIGEVFSQTVLTGPMLLAIPVAILAGAVSFLSPCVLPLVPGYVGYITGLGATALTDRKPSKVIIGVSLFMTGFAVVFVAMGLAFSVAGVLLSQWADVLNRVMGIVVIIAGIVFMGGFGWLAAARPPASEEAQGRTVGRTRARGDLRARLGAVHRPDPGRCARPVHRFRR